MLPRLLTLLGFAALTFSLACGPLPAGRVVIVPPPVATPTPAPTATPSP